MLRNLFAIGLISAIFIGLRIQGADAGDTVNYQSPCKYFDKSGSLKVSTTCRVVFKTLDIERATLFVVIFPDGAQITVYNRANGKAETNNILSDVAIAGRNVVVATVEDEIFIFNRPIQR